ncbi:transporter substrate-binding domain-containing protein [Geomonas sp. Red32]|uniref:ATP-binding protein n=1 Tax=Geomonas sp. Red32 TaxID=2912856 RepID=UPI00202CC72A|nr:transporter substrate-binding domain-containing protein [Geomonas sp. Red32]MCM0082940.1 transporter substrate-binding domain-containing protein [Geomonas sp. Red32]
MRKVLLLILAIATVLSVSAAHAAPREVRVAAFNFYPTLFQAPDQTVKGAYVDLLNEIARREGWTVTYVYGNWADGLARVQSGEVDVVTNVAYTAERAKFLDYGKTPVLTVWAELYVPAGSSIENIRDVRNKRIGVEKGDFNGASFKNMVDKFEIPCRLVEYGDFEDLFKAVAAGEVDGGVANNTFGSAKQHDYGLHSSGVIFNPFDIYFAVAKGRNREVLATLDHYLDSWRRTEGSPYHQALERWSHGSASTIRVMPGWLREAFVAVAALLALSVAFAALLRRQVRRKTAEIVHYGEELHLTARQLEDELAERQRAEELLTDQAAVLRESESRFRTMFDASSDAIIIHGADSGAIVDVNRTMCEMYGYSHDEVLTLTAGALSAGTSPYSEDEAIAFIKRAALGEQPEFPWHARAADGRLFWVEVRMRRVQLGNDRCVLATVTDVTHRKSLEEQLQQSLKMESIGRLAGGVAHDFNNMLCVILGRAELSKLRLSPEDPLWGAFDQIVKAAERSSQVTRQLLAFSRKQPIAPKPVNLNALIVEHRKNLGRLIGEDIRFVLQAGEGLWNVLIDPVQIDQILMNLSVNARDAMPQGGTLAIETANVTIMGDRQEGGAPGPGDYVRLTVADTGVGMDSETRDRIFEPFFTTKEIGKGTGLGLSTVYGIVAQNDGVIQCESTPGAGTVFTVYLPRLKGESGGEDASAAGQAHGSGTILLVEDEEMLLITTTGMLEEMGYTVLQAASPQQAIALCERGTRVDLVLTDVVMPGMNGEEMVARIRRVWPECPVLFMSGYTRSFLEREHRGEMAGVNFIAKPFDIKQLNDAVSALIG